jgi:hypothetical protein
LTAFEFDLRFQVVLVEVARHRDDLGDHRRACDRGSRVPGAGARAVDGALDRFADGFHLDDVLFHHGVRRQRFDRVMLHAVTVPGSGELQQLDGGRADVDPISGG